VPHTTDGVWLIEALNLSKGPTRGKPGWTARGWDTVVKNATNWCVRNNITLK
jgi:hypothetical protein